LQNTPSTPSASNRRSSVSSSTVHALTGRPAVCQAFIDASTVTAAQGVSVTALGAATIVATAGDKASANAAAGLLLSAKEAGPASFNVGGVLVTNKVVTQTSAYIDNGTGTSTVTATAGTINVAATDQASISATSTIDLTAVAMLSSHLAITFAPIANIGLSGTATAAGGGSAGIKFTTLGAEFGLAIPF